MNVVGYCRFSSEGQRDGYSIEAQQRVITEFCKTKNYNIIKFYVDEARTGTNDNREQFQQMILDSTDKTFQAVVVYKSDRFARNLTDATLYKSELKNNDVYFISATEPINTYEESNNNEEDTSSKLIECIYDYFAEKFSRDLSKRVRDGKYEVALLHQHNGGKPPYGYDVKDKKYIINEKEANIVRLIFEQAALGLSHAAITKYINNLGYKNRDNKEFNCVYITRILTNEFYKGTLVFGAKSKRKKAKVMKIDDAIPAIITKETFDSIYRKYEDNRIVLAEKFRKARAKNKGIDYLLTGYLYCGICGAPITGFHCHKSYVRQTDGQNVHYSSYWYRCANKATRENKVRCTLKNIHQDQLENYIFKAIENIIFSDANLKILTGAIKDRLLQKLNEKNDNDKYLHEIDKAQKQLDRLLDVYLEGLIDKSKYALKKIEFERTIKLNQDQIKQYPKFNIEVITVDFVKKAINNFRNSFKADTVEYKKKTLSTFIDRIVLTNETLTIYFKFPIDTDDSQKKQEFLFEHHFLHNSTTASTVVPISNNNLIIKVEVPIECLYSSTFNNYTINII